MHNINTFYFANVQEQRCMTCGKAVRIARWYHPEHAPMYSVHFGSFDRVDRTFKRNARVRWYMTEAGVQRAVCRFFAKIEGGC